jgi:hypothetical protein
VDAQNNTVAPSSTAALNVSILPYITDFSPKILPAKGDTILKVQGFGFDIKSNYTCLLSTKSGGALFEVSAIVGSAHAINCTIPKLRYSTLVTFLQIRNDHGVGQVAIGPHLGLGEILFESRWISLNISAGSAAGNDLLLV